MKWLTSNRVWWVTSITAALAAPPLLLRAGPRDFDVKRGRVSAMPQTERDRLTRNFEEYLKLTEDQREHYRRLHASLQQDQQENGGRYTRDKDDYFAWVSGLPAYQQQRLLTTTDPAERIKLVGKYLEEQEQRQAEEELRKLGPTRNFFRFTPLLSSSELAAVMAELEKGVTLSVEQKQRLEEKPDGIDRYLEFFKIVTERKLRINQLVDEAKAERLVEALPERVREKWSRSTRQERMGALTGTIIWNLRKEIEVQTRARQPDADKLQEFVKQWPEDQSAELDELMDLSPDDFVQRVREQYAAKNLELDWEHVRRTFPPEWGPGPRGRPGPAGGSRPPGETGDARRGPQNNE